MHTFKSFFVRDPGPARRHRSRDRLPDGRRGADPPGRDRAGLDLLRREHGQQLQPCRHHHREDARQQVLNFKIKIP